MKVVTNTSKVENSQKLILELLLSDQPKIKDKNFQRNHFWKILHKKKINNSRFLPKNKDYVPNIDQSHPAMTVSLDACIQCGLFIRACRDVQVNDVLGMSGRGADIYPVFDMNNPMGESSCVGCGECVQACPTGALIETSLLDNKNNKTVKLNIFMDFTLIL